MYTKGEWKASKDAVGRWMVHIEGKYGLQNMIADTVPVDKADSECKANARLIAAAPKLYEALTLLLKNCYKDKRGAYWVRRVDINEAEQAIAEVEGK